MTQFVDFRRSNGRYTKIRAMVIGGHMTLHHLCHSDDWLVNARVRFNSIDDYIMLSEEETERDWKHLIEMVGEMHKRIGLDYYGMDIGVLDDGSFVLFEANAAMTAVNTEILTPERREQYLPLLTKMVNRLANHLIRKGIPLRPLVDLSLSRST